MDNNEALQQENIPNQSSGVQDDYIEGEPPHTGVPPLTPNPVPTPIVEPTPQPAPTPIVEEIKEEVKEVEDKIKKGTEEDGSGLFSFIVGAVLCAFIGFKK